MDLFKKLGGIEEQFMANPDLESFLLHHVLRGSITSGSLRDGVELTTLQGGKLIYKGLLAKSVQEHFSVL